MNGLVVLAAAACVASGQFIAPGLAPAPGASSQFLSDPVNGFRVSATNLPVAPVAPAAPAVAPLAAPVFDLPLPVAPEETAEVAAARAAHAEALAAAQSAAEAAPAEERKRREAEEEKAAPIVTVNPYTAGIFAPGVYAAAPGQIVANINTPTPVTAPVAAFGYAGIPAALPAAPLAAPLAAAAPSREAVLTTIKANPGHAIVYTVS